MTETKTRPITFDAPMVRAILDGRKTQTRRVLKPQPRVGGDYARCAVCDRSKAPRGRSIPLGMGGGMCSMESTVLCPGYYEDPPPDHLFPGESLGDFGFPEDWAGPCPYHVGQKLWVRETWRHSGGVDVRTMEDGIHYRADPDECAGGPWRASIHMPRWASRLTLDVTEVQVARVQDINKEDAAAEGLKKPGEAWADNPWVWVVTFEKATGRRG